MPTNIFKYQMLLELKEAFSTALRGRTKLTAARKYSEEEDSWLPCCSSGFSDMNYADAKAFKSAWDIFDCTCIKVPAKA